MHRYGTRRVDGATGRPAAAGNTRPTLLVAATHASPASPDQVECLAEKQRMRCRNGFAVVSYPLRMAKSDINGNQRS